MIVQVYFVVERDLGVDTTKVTLLNQVKEETEGLEIKTLEEENEDV